MAFLAATTETDRITNTNRDMNKTVIVELTDIRAKTLDEFVFNAGKAIEQGFRPVRIVGIMSRESEVTDLSEFNGKVSKTRRRPSIVKSEQHNR